VRRRTRSRRPTFDLLAIGLLAIGLLTVEAFTAARGGERSLFSSYDVVALRLEAPFDELFAQAKHQPEYVVDGTLSTSTAGEPIPVKISLRGHTSRRETECSFPKLKVEAAGGGALLGGKALKIGTHCGESTDNALTVKFGRLPNERSPWREAAVYRLLDALRIPALRARPARITYVYSDRPEGSDGAVDRRLERNAMLLEDDDDAIERLGGKKEITADEFTTADELFSREDAANLAFAEALIGNFDWCVRFSAGDTYRCDARLKLWNVIAARTGGGKARPIMYDFDVSGMVTGSHRWFGTVYNAAFVPSKSEREVEVIAQVQRTRTLFSRGELDASRRRFLERRADAYKTIDEADIDADGRRLMRDYADAFYREIEADEAFYRPVVTQEGVTLRANAGAGAQAICASGGPVPPGTPVGGPLDVRGGMVKVVVLDALWHWAPPVKCPAVQHGSAWIARRAIGKNFPSR
jgi:hypothetical protein